jgi:hypothetical protein
MYVHTDAIRHVDSRRSCGVGQAVFVNGTRRVEAVFAETQVQICVADVEKREMVQFAIVIVHTRDKQPELELQKSSPSPGVQVSARA